MKKGQISIAEKALTINLNKPLYGTLAEIGAGQEVARWFFKVGGAAGTIAKAMSAYDMKFSDAIYGQTETGRYVVENRVKKMLEHEFNLLETRLGAEVNAKKHFFVFADTVAAKSFKFKGDCHGWMGVQFQLTADQTPSQFIIHVRMLDKSNLMQQEALGTLGVNMIYSAYYYNNDQVKFLESLLDGDLEDRVEINLFKFDGPVFKSWDQTKTNLKLLELKMAPAILFCPKEQVNHLGEELFNKQVIVHRIETETKKPYDTDILISARNFYCGRKTEGACDPYLIAELKTEDFSEKNIHDIMERIQQIHLAGGSVLVTSLKEDYSLADLFETYTKQHINFVYEANKLVEIFSLDKMNSIENIARLFKDRTHMYIYPALLQNLSSDEKKSFNVSNPLQVSLKDFKPPEKYKHLFLHLTENNHIQEIDNIKRNLIA